MSAAILAAELEAAYRAEAALYTQALHLAEQWFCETPEAGEPENAKGPVPLSGERVLARITELLAEVQGIEDHLAAVKTQWHDSASSPSGALADTLAQVADIIRNLQAQLDRVGRHTRQRKNELAPELDGVIRSEHMRRAYGDARPGDSRPGDSRTGDSRTGAAALGGSGDGR